MDLRHRTAAAEMWSISSLRQEVFSLLDRSSLAECLRLEKGCFGEVVEALYREVEYETVLKTLGEGAEHVSIRSRLAMLS